MKEIIVDNFAGGGGASTGIEMATGRPVALCWLSPDCTHFSKAKGGKPREKKIRGLAWVAVNNLRMAVQEAFDELLG